jgi:predicted AAA+ superfamily ATPase
MEPIINQAASLASSIFIANIPNIPMEHKIPLSVISSDLVRLGIKSLANTSTFLKKYMTWNNYNCIEIPYLAGDNPTFIKMENYILMKFSNQLETLRLVPKNGHQSGTIQDTRFKTNYLTDTFNTQKVYIYPSSDVIKITSKQLNHKDLEVYVSNVSKEMSAIQTKCLTIYNINCQESSKKSKDGDESKQSRYLKWQTVQCYTNKSMSNTIMTKKVEEELYDDIRNFLSKETEMLYAKRGLPYQKGILLHGPPGTGKSSCIKALALEFNLPIFTINLNIIENDAELDNLTNRMLNITEGTKYIVAFEDVDRTNFAKSNHNRNTKESSVVSIGAIINFMDGVIEANGRIIILTANNRDLLDDFPVLIRPGRIDKDIEIGFCKLDQIIQMTKLFYPDNEIPDQQAVKIPENLSPATYIKILNSTNGNFQKVLNYLYRGHTDISEDTSQRETKMLLNNESNLEKMEIEASKEYKDRIKLENKLRKLEREKSKASRHLRWSKKDIKRHQEFDLEKQKKRVEKLIQTKTNTVKKIREIRKQMQTLNKRINKKKNKK